MTLLEVYEQVVKALDARALVRKALSRLPQPGPGGKLKVLGLGKIAAEMYAGLEGAPEAVLVVPADAPAPASALVLRGGHPLPDHGSLQAGEALPSDSHTPASTFVSWSRVTSPRTTTWYVFSMR